MTLTCCCEPVVNFPPAAHGTTWEGGDFTFEREDLPTAVSIVFDFYRAGSDEIAFSVDEASGATVIDPVAWHFSIGPFDPVTFPPGVYSIRLLVTTDIETIEEPLQGIWIINA